MPRARRTDDNHKQIMALFRDHGCTVADISRVGGGVPDILVGKFGLTCEVEIKDGTKPPSHRRLTDAESVYHNTHRGWVEIVEGVDDVQRVVMLLRQKYQAISGL